MRASRPVARDSEAVGGRPVFAARHDGCAPATAPRPPVTHSYATLVLCTGGRARVEQGGEWTLREGELLLVPAGEPHRSLEQRRMRGWTLAFSAPVLAAHGGAPLLEPFERVRDGGSAVVPLPPERRAYLETLLAELAREVGRAPRPGRPGLDAVERSLLTLILIEVGRAATAQPPGLVADGPVAGEALRFIERHCLGPLSLGEVAAAVGRSPAHVTAALTKATGRSAGKWIVSGRMAEARRLLLHSGLRVDLVAERVGYAEVTHFTRMFRREHGLTPAAWRRAHARSAPG